MHLLWYPLVQVKISDAAIEVLEDVRKPKPRVQKAPKPLKPSSASPGAQASKRGSRFKFPKWRSSKKMKSKDEQEMEMNLLDGKEE